MATFEKTVRGDIGRIDALIDSAVLNSGMSVELVGQSAWRAGDAQMRVRVYEKYYWRASNRASLTVTLAASGDSVFVSAIGSGGGQGPIFKFSWGAEESFVSVVQRALERI